MTLAGQARVAAWVAGLAFSQRAEPRMRVERTARWGRGAGREVPLFPEAAVGVYRRTVRHARWWANPRKIGPWGGERVPFYGSTCRQKPCSYSLIAGAAGAVVTSGDGEAEIA